MLSFSLFVHFLFSLDNLVVEHLKRYNLYESRLIPTLSNTELVFGYLST